MNLHNTKGPRLLVCGSRAWKDKVFLHRVLTSIAQKSGGLSFLIEGEAAGADTMAKDWAKQNHVPILAFPAKWSMHGRKAGMIRNREMLIKGRPTFVCAFTAGSTLTRGTANMVALTKKAKIPLTIYYEKEPTHAT